MRYKPDELKERIPTYLNGRLSEEERQEFEDAMNRYPELRRELMEFSEIKGIYKDIEREIPPISDNLYSRILTSIRSGTDKETVQQRKGYIEQLQEFFMGLFASPRVSWGIVAAQVVIILFLIIAMPGDDSLRTLTSQSTLQEELVRINVVFEEEAREKEIRDVLNKIGADVIGGPSAEGLYVIQIKDRQDIEVALKVLRDLDIVKFADKAY